MKVHTLYATGLIWLSLFSVCASAQDNLNAKSLESLEDVSALREAGKLSEAKAGVLLILERSRIDENSLEMASAFSELGYILEQQNDYMQAFRSYNRALDIYTQQQRYESIAKTLSDIGQNYRYRASYKQAFDYLNRAMELYESLGNTLGVARQQLNVGLVYKSLGRYEDALSSLTQALRVLRTNDDTESVSLCLSNIGDIYRDMGQLKNAETYLTDALTINKQTGSVQQTAKTHQKLGDLYLEMGRFEQARLHLNQAVKKFSGIDAPLDHERANVALAQVELAVGQYDVGLTLLQQALLRATDGNFITLQTHIHQALANAFLEQDDYDTALQHAQKGLLQAREREELATQAQLLSVLVDIYSAQGNYQQAFNSLLKKNDVLEQVVDRDNTLIVRDMQTEIELDRQAQSIELLRKNRAIALAEAKQRNLRTSMVLGGLIALLLVIFLLWSRYKERQLTRTLKREVRNRTQELEVKNLELENAYRTLEQASLRDPLTGLYNRHHLEAQLPGEIQRCQHAHASGDAKQGNHDLLCFLIDIDHFKDINDVYGHLAGDRFLVQFAQIIRDVFRQTDLTIRWGGEEFLVICRYSSRDLLVDLASRFSESVRQHVFELGGKVRCNATCSIGFAPIPLDKSKPFEHNWQTMFALVDYCLYAAKQSGRNAWVGVSDVQSTMSTATESGPLASKFELSGARVSTSLNNLASIAWPENPQTEIPLES
ncbi:tetratricopeptide repeat-containing diguanylate cyclase [Alteromonas halophila]|uniref:diguanylate cyclase n=1 Tax=Alteromonas halophila TaxID=516698 RepID=A0A918N0K5_9ALTE|nr:diguanylate cyclase [Alteromonas halophila]GGW94330.1 hypothetical protein GCM10007391_30810 [Alteromonas halophila]